MLRDISELLALQSFKSSRFFNHGVRLLSHDFDTNITERICGR
jgi:hypothetical protein